MMEEFLHKNSMYIVLGIALIIWFGIVLYLFYIDRKITKLENEIKINKENKNCTFQQKSFSPKE